MIRNFLSLIFTFLCLYSLAQTPNQLGSMVPFDKAAVLEKAKQLSSNPANQKEYYESQLKRYISSHRRGAPVINANRNYGYSYDAANNRTIINLSPLSSYCPNAGFDNSNFTNWIGGTYSNLGVNWNTFTPAWTPGIVTMGNNTPQQPAVSWTAPIPRPNRHTILNIPPLSNNPPANCIGWDSIAVTSGTHLSDIPFVPPTASGVTCRLGNANNDDETEHLSYVMNVTTNNAQFTYAYAVVLYDGGHLAGEQPFFEVTMTDQNGNPILGCGQYQVSALNIATDTTFHRASQWSSFSNSWTDGYIGTAQNPSWFYDVYYKRWTLVSVDLTPYLGQNVTIDFRTADCIYGGHWGYAYVDAQCGPAVALVNMCTGNSTQQAVGPPGYVSYQWYGPNSNTLLIPPPNGTNSTLNITNGTVGDIYYLTAIAANGCTTQVQAILQYSSVNVQYTNSTPSCPTGNSGTANVVAGGSPGPFTYTWTNSSGVNVGNANPCTNLSPGTYSVQIAAPGCGSFDTTVTVGISPPITQNVTRNFCGNATYLSIPGTGFTNIQWYNSTGAIANAHNDTLLAQNVSNGQVYSATYVNGGCVDSLIFSLTQVTGGTLMHTGVTDICIGASNGQATENLSTTQLPPYNFSVSGPGGFSQVNNGVAFTTLNLTGLAFGTYTVNAFDGMCFYSDLFKIDTIPVPVFITVAPKSLCSNDTAKMNFTFGGAPPTQCGPSSFQCLNPTNFTSGVNNAVNFSPATSYPTPFGNFYTKMRAQYIYTASELTAAGLSAGQISKVAFNCNQINGATTYPDFNVSIGCTTQSTYNAFPMPTDLILGLTNVYSSAGYNVIAGINTFGFTQPYNWDGVSNLVVEVCFEFPGQYNYTLNSAVDLFNTTNYSSIAVLSDTDPMCAGLSSTGFYFAMSQKMRPVATFGWCSSVATPNMYTYSLNPNTGIVPPFTPINPPTTVLIQPTTTTNYTFSATSLFGGCVKKDTFTLVVIKPFNIVVPPNQSFCTNTPATSIIANFTDANTGNPVTEQGNWTGAGISLNNGTGTATFSPSSTSVGSHTLMITAGGQCLFKDSTVYTVIQWNSGAISPIGPFCIYNAPKQVPSVTPGGIWGGQVNTTGLFTPATAGVSTALNPPYFTITYLVNANTMCADSSSIQITVFNKPTVDFTTDTIMGCAPLDIVFIPIVSPPGGTVKWYYGDGNASNSNSHIYPYQGVYSPMISYETATTDGNCRDSISKANWITVYPMPKAAFVADPTNTTILEPTINFTNESNPRTNMSWLWNISSLDLFTTENVSYQFNNPGTYQITLYVSTQHNCRDSITQSVVVEPDYVLYVPSAFTPNFDGKNDVFQAKGYGIQTGNFDMTIFDRWGEKVFEANSIDKGWDGTFQGVMSLQDVYVWEISFMDNTGKKYTRTGSVALLP